MFWAYYFSFMLNEVSFYFKYYAMNCSILWSLCQIRKIEGRIHNISVKSKWKQTPNSENDVLSNQRKKVFSPWEHLRLACSLGQVQESRYKEGPKVVLGSMPFCFQKTFMQLRAPILSSMPVLLLPKSIYTAPHSNFVIQIIHATPRSNFMNSSSQRVPM